MDNYDGYITIGTKIDTSGIKNEISNMKKTLSSDMSSIEKNMTQSMSKLENGISKTLNVIKASILGAGLVLLFKQINNSIGGAISRLDTLSNYTKVMSNLGVSADDAKVSIDYLSEKLIGLPTTLDDAVASVQRFTSANSNVKASTQMFLALNNAILAGGANAQVQSSALEQLSQAYSKGRPDMMEWRTAMMAMPAQLKQVAISMGYVNADELGEALRKGTVSMNDFMIQMMKLNKEGVNGFQSFEEQARNSTGGIATSMTNVKTAITRGLAQVMEAIGQSNIAGFFQGIARAINAVIPYIVSFVRLIMMAVNYIRSLFGGTSKVADNMSTSIGGTSSQIENLNDNLGNTASGLDKATGSAKALNKELKTTASFDELNIIKDNQSSNGGGGGGGSTGGVGANFGNLNIDGFDFEEKMSNKIDKLNEILKKINLEPLKKSIKNMAEAIQYFGKGSFKILKTFLNDYIKPLANYVISDALPHFLNSTADALKLVNFDKINDGLSKLLKALEPFTERIFEGLLWFYDKVLIPIGLWTVNDVLPAFLNILAEYIKILTRVIDDFKPYFKWFWDKALQPLAKYTGGLIVKILNAIGDALKWISENETATKVLEFLIKKLLEMTFNFTGLNTVVKLATGLLQDENKAVLDVKDSKEKLKKATEDLKSAENDYIESVDRAEQSLNELRDAEDRTGLSGDELNRLVEQGIIDYRDMTTEQREVYKAYLNNEEAQERLKDSTDRLADAKKQEKEASEQNKWATYLEEKEYEKYKDAIVTAFNNGQISAEEARKYIGLAMEGMSDDSRQAFVEDIPNDIRDGLNVDNYSSWAERLIDWWNNSFIGSLIKDVKLALNYEVTGRSSNVRGGGSGGGGHIRGNALGAIYYPQYRLATGGIINMPGRRCAFRYKHWWRKRSRRSNTVNTKSSNGIFRF